MIAWILAASLTAPATADTVSMVTLPAVDVPGERTRDERLRREPRFARVYEVAAHRGRPGTVSELLAGTVGVHVRRFGGVGGFSTASIRGSSAGQVAMYLDGVPLNSAQYGVVNLGDFPLAALDAVEVHRGGTPLGLDSPGGGVIHLLGRRADETWLAGSAGHGSFTTRRGGIEGGWRRGSRSALLVAQYLATAGDFSYLDDNGTPLNASDDTVRARRNHAVESLALTGRVEQGLGPIGLSLVHDHLTKSQGTPGDGADPALRATLRTDRSVSNLLLRWAGARRGENAILPDAPRLRLFLTEQRDRFSDPDGELTGVRQEDDDRTRRIGVQIGAGTEFLPGQTIRTDAGLRHERYVPHIVRPTPRALPRSDRRVAEIGGELRSTLLGGRLGLVGTLRRHVTDDTFPGGPPYPGALPVPAGRRVFGRTNSNIGARLDLPAGLALKGSHARLARMPTLEELFGNRAGIYGNPRAQPESIETVDAGLIGAWSWAPAGMARALVPLRLETQLSAYRSRATDLLVFIQNSQRTSVAQNISAARLEGLEGSLRAAWASGLAADVSWTRQWTRDEGAIAYWHGRELPGRPRDEVATRLAGTFAGWRVFHELHFIGANFLDRFNLRRVPARALHDVGLAVSPWGSWIEWSAECRNLTDVHAQDFDGYPLPGRMFYLGMQVRLARKEITP